MVTKSDFVLEWDRALGFKADPFVNKIFTPINKFLVNRNEEKEKINWFFIKNYFYGALVGEQGVGKTTMLRWLENRLMKYNRIHAVYINAAVFKEQVNVLHSMIMPLLSFYEKRFSKPHTKMLSADLLVLLKKKLGHKSVALLLDNAHHLTDKNLELIKSLRKENLKLQVLVTSTPKGYEKSRLAELGQDELNITLRRLTFDEAKEMIQCRVEAFGGKGIYPFSEEDLKKMHDKADKNPKEFLKQCRDQAIKILIHKREQLDKKARARPRAPEAKPLKTSVEKSKVIDKKPEEKIASDEAMDVKVRKATKREVDEERKEEKKKLIKIKFDLGKKPKKKPRKPVHKPVRVVKPTPHRSAIHDEEHKQDLLDQLSSTSPRRKDKNFEEPRRDEEHISETDKLLRELSEEFEVD